MSNETSSQPDFLRPVEHENNPGLTEDTFTDLPTYDFLLTGITREGHQKNNSVTFDPVGLQLPWPSSFPAARQCKYWLEAETEYVVETQRSGSCESTITEVIVRCWPEILANPQAFYAHSGDWCVKLALEILAANAQGPDLIRAFLSWMNFTKLQAREGFISLREYLDYRAGNIGQDYIFSCTRFSENIQLSNIEQNALEDLIKLSTDHIIFVNDYFSYEREIQESRRHCSPCLNAIKYIEDTLSIETSLAKNVALHLLQALESQICEEFEKLQDSGALNLSQVSLA
ncbi:terpenoid synthase [Penicillium concentricum]|uniref:Terpenoid synthase n=1 Tax=Penicillium concentricum TaxID=293559 RepID=A0A9W9SVU2_9EURO|nr:terpenoid synthase [Penicillium concentricum]KAJ5385312.1 terpenoid synthase [Penicillium concentricum]